MLSHKNLKILAYLYLFLITIIFLVPLDSFLVRMVVSEKDQPTDLTSLFIHLTLFFILYILFNLTHYNVIKILILFLIYSVLIEFTQIFTGRGFEMLDVVFNVIGVILGYLFSIIIKKNNVN